jgi:ADP-ribose pyrophosphatase YjhB (NUDIX family)
MSSDGRKKETLPLREDIPLLGRWVASAFQRYWRVVRGFCLSVEACVIDEAGHALMIRNENSANWNLPRGTVLKGENIEMALRRTLEDAAGVEANQQPEVMFFYSAGQSEQRGVYLVRHWRGPRVRRHRETLFFPLDALPANIDPEVCVRIRRLVEGRTISQV